MSKTNTKKTLTVMISIAMVFSALAILSLTATPAFAATGTITSNPTNLAITGGNLESTIVVFNGGTFNSTATITFYIGTTAAFSTNYKLTGSVTLPAGATTMSNTVVTLSSSGLSLTAGTWYIAATDHISATAFTTPEAVTLTSVSPSFTAVGTTNVGTSQELTGSNFDASASVAVYLDYAGYSVVIGTTTTDSSGAFDFYATIPALAQGTYNLVAQETNSLSTSFTEGGITADSSMTIAPAITITPGSTDGAAGAAFTIVGSGFASGDSIAASSPGSSSTGSDITIGGSDTYFSAITVASDGSFTASVTTISSIASTAGGGKSVVITDLSSSPVTFTNYVYVSVPDPAALGFIFGVTATVSGVYNVGGAVTTAVWNFPADTSVSIYLGSVLVGTATTDSNGFGKLPSTTTVPAIPASTSGTAYNAYATTSVGLVKEVPSAANTTIKSDYQVTDPSNSMMTSSSVESFPSTGNYIVSAFGLDPTATYSWTDSVAALSTSSPSVVKVTAGSYSSSTGDFTPAANGTLNFTYAPAFTTPAAGSAATASFTLENTVSSIDVAAYHTYTFEYSTITLVSVSSPGYFNNQGAGTSGLSFTQSGFITAGSTIYPGNTSKYNVYIGSNELTIGGVTAISTSTLATLATYTNPSLTSGVYNLSVVYNGQPISSAIFTEPIIISAGGTSLTSGGIALELNSAQSKYVLVGYGFDGSDTITGGYMSSTGYTAWTFTTTLSSSTNGVFITSNGPAYPLNDVSGTYYAYATASLSGSTNTVSTSYTVSPSLTISSPSTSSGPIDTVITGYATGLQSQANYDVYLGSNYITTLTSTATGAIGSSGSPSTLVSASDFPLVPAGKYTLSLDSSGTTTAVASATFTVKANSDLTLGTSSQYAFPGQIVTFSATGFSLPTPFVTAGGTLHYFAQIALNGTIIATVPATLSSTTLYGAFENPNNVSTAYYKLTITGYAQASTLTSSAGSITDGGFAQEALTGSVSDFFGLVSGNGALLTGITSSEIAILEADINSTVSTSLTVPISQLNAAITSINGAVATLKTTVGNITTDLSTINATVASISSGQALVLTDLGSISTSLASLNASLVAFNNNVVTINTTLGQVVTSLGSVQTQVKANANGIATVTTDIGTVQGQIVSQNGNITTVKTSLGTLTANVSKVQSQTSGFPTLEIFLIVIIVLVLITLVISFLAVNAANKAARRATEEKKP